MNKKHMKHRFYNQGEGMKPSSTSTILSSFIALLLMVLISISPAAADQYESEFNDTKATATSVTYGDLVVGSLGHALDYDWYKVEIPSAGLVSLTAYYEFPDDATVVKDAMFVELRTADNVILSDFYIDYEEKDPAYIRDVNIPSSGNYYIVVYCATTTNYQRDRYYLTVSQGGGERSSIKIQNEEPPVIVADGKSQATISAQVLDRDDKPVMGAPVVFSIADSTASGTMTFSGNTNTSTESFSVEAGTVKEFSITTNASRFAIDLYNLTTGRFESNIFYSWSAPTGATTVHTFTEAGVYYLNIDVSPYVDSTVSDVESVVSWGVVMSTRGGDDGTISAEELDVVATDVDGVARYVYKSTEKKGTFLILASFGNDVDQISLEQTAGEPTQINLVDLQDGTSDTKLYTDRYYTINATLVDKFGNSVEDGVEVRLQSSLDSATGTKLQIVESIVETKNGRAEFSISAPRSTEYTITATIVDNSSLSDTSTLRFDSINMNNMMIRPAYVLADGETESIISLRMSDTNGKAISGEPVDFTASCGSLLQDSAVSDDNGIAQVSLRAPYQPGDCTVTAVYGTKKLTTQVQYYGDGSGSTAASISLVADKEKVPANGYNSVVLTATLSNSAGEAVPAGTPVHFETTHGRFLNGEKEFSGAMPGGTVKVALLTVAEEIGKAMVRCTSGGVSQMIQVLFTEVGPDGTPIEDQTAYITLEAAPATIMGDGKSSLLVTAELFNSTGGHVPAGTEIVFYATNGTFANGLLQSTATTTDDTGKMSVALISSATDFGPVDIWCYSNGIFQITSVMFQDPNAPTAVGQIALTANPATIDADGQSSTAITAEITDILGAPVPSGTPVVFTTSAGRFANNETTITVSTTDDSGKAVVPLISSDQAGIARLSVTSEGASQSILVIFQGGSNPDVGSIALEADPQIISADGLSSSTLMVTVTDFAGAAVPIGTEVTLTTTLGHFSNGRQTVTMATRDASGQLRVSLISSTDIDIATVTATSGGVSQQIEVVFEKSGTPDLGLITLTADPMVIPADGASSTTLTVALKDMSGNAVPIGTPVVLTTTLGRFSNGTTTISLKTVDESGQLMLPLLAATEGNAGFAEVRATSGGVTQLVIVTFQGPGAIDIGTITLSADPDSIAADGISSTTLTVTVTDVTGSPAPSGTEVILTTLLGKFSNGNQTITVELLGETGQIRVPLIAKTTAGIDRVTATTGGLSQSLSVTFQGEVEPGKTASIQLSADPEQIPADGRSSLTITATLLDATGQPMPEGTEATFTASSGVFGNGTTTYPTTITGDSGTITISLISSIAAGTSDITCSSNGVTQLVTVYFVGPGGGIGETASIALSASPASIPADGYSSTTITITMKDSTGQPVNIGTQATLTTTLGTLSQSTVATVDDSGVISVALTAGTEAGSARVVCTSNGITQSIVVVFTGDDPGGETPASLSLGLSQISVKTDNSDSTIVTATVLDANSAVIEGVPVSFSADRGQLSSALVETDVNGEAAATFSCGTTNRSNGIANITVDVAVLTERVIPVQIYGSTLTISDTGTDLILNDPTSISTLTITAQDAGGNPIYDTQLAIALSGTGMLRWKLEGDAGYGSPTTAQTDISGQIVIEVIGTGAGNPILTASGLGDQAPSRTFTVAGLADSFGIVLPESDLTNVATKDIASLAITGPMTTLAFNDTNPDTIVRSDIGGDFTTESYAVGDQVMVGGSAGNDGRYTIATIAATTLTLEASDALTAEAAGENVTLTNSVVVRVRAPSQTQVRFATTIGQLNGEGVQVKTVNVVGGFASVVVSSDLAGVATVEVSDVDNPATVDRVSIAFSRPSVEAATITLQANTAAIPPSIGDNKSIAEFTAYVKTSGATGNQAVEGVPVIFSIKNSTGSGEFVSPVIVYTNAAGEAKTIFTAGSLGSDAEGVTVTARVVGSAITDFQKDISFVPPRTIRRVVNPLDPLDSFVADGFKSGQQIRVEGSANNNDGYYTIDGVTATDLTLDAGDTVVAEGAGANVLITALTHSTNIVIGGTSGSVVIGRGAGDSIVILNPTSYSLFMSVLVSDLNGNPVSGADVSLNLWPIQYNTGVWFDLNDRVSDHYVPYISGSFQNEDINENTFLDPGEDTNKDGILTPPNSASGNIPTLLTTDENGLAEFNIIYLKSSAIWIGARIRATTMVFGTETKASMEFTLPAEKTEAEAGYLPPSPYPYVLICSSGGIASFLLKPFAGDSYDIFTSSLADVTITGVAGGVDTDGNGTIDAYSSYRYDYTDPGLPSGTIRYDSVTVTDAACSVTFPVKIIIE